MPGGIKARARTQRSGQLELEPGPKTGRRKARARHFSFKKQKSILSAVSDTSWDKVFAEHFLDAQRVDANFSSPLFCLSGVCSVFASLRYYMGVGVQRMMLGSLSISCVLLSDRLDVNLLGAVILAVFWQQCGWLAHDFLHHQVGSLWLRCRGPVRRPDCWLGVQSRLRLGLGLEYRATAQRMSCLSEVQPVGLPFSVTSHEEVPRDQR